MRSTTRIRFLVELQGYVGLTDRAVMDINPWLRVAPAICAGWSLLSSLAGSAIAVALLAAIACLGAILPWHPFDLPYNLVIRRWTRTAPIPRPNAPRRFACGVAAIWLAATGAALAAGASALGAALGIALTVVALVPVATGLCVPSWILRRLGFRMRCAMP